MIEKIIIGVILAVVGAFVSFMFWRIENKIDVMEKENSQRHDEQVKIRIAERELLLAEADISALTARAIRGEVVNGELEKAEKTLQEKKTEINNITLKTAIKVEVAS